LKVAICSLAIFFNRRIRFSFFYLFLFFALIFSLSNRFSKIRRRVSQDLMNHSPPFVSTASVHSLLGCPFGSRILPPGAGSFPLSLWSIRWRYDFPFGFPFFRRVVRPPRNSLCLLTHPSRPSFLKVFESDSTRILCQPSGTQASRIFPSNWSFRCTNRAFPASFQPLFIRSSARSFKRFVSLPSSY